MRNPDARSLGSRVPSGSHATCWQTRSFGMSCSAFGDAPAPQEPRLNPSPLPSLADMPGLTQAHQLSISSQMQPNEALSLDEIRLGDPAFWMLPPDVREGAFRMLRRERPISFHQEVDDRLFPPGPGFWALSRHADILYAGTHPKLFCSGKGATSIADIPTDFLEFFGSMINMDAPKHGRLRRLVSTAFTERLLSRVEHEVQEAASRVIDAVSEKGECDFVTEIAAPFPIRIICEMMGIPENQHGFAFEQTTII